MRPERAERFRQRIDAPPRSGRRPGVQGSNRRPRGRARHGDTPSASVRLSSSKRPPLGESAKREMLAGEKRTPSASASLWPSTTRKRACNGPACVTTTTRPPAGTRAASAATAARTRAHTSSNDSPPVGVYDFGDVDDACARAGVRATISDHVDPSHEPKRISRQRASRSIGSSRPRTIHSAVSRARERSLANGRIESLVRQRASERARLLAAAFVERHIRMTLKAPVDVPRGASVPHGDEFEVVTGHEKALPIIARQGRHIASLVLQKRRAFVRDEKIVHVARVLFFFRENPFEHDARRRVLVRKITNELAVMVDGDALGDQILFDHVDQFIGFTVFGGGTRCESLRAEVRLAAELIDAFGYRFHVFLLFARVLGELVLDGFAIDSDRSDRVHRVTQDADDFG